MSKKKKMPLFIGGRGGLGKKKKKKSARRRETRSLCVERLDQREGEEQEAGQTACAAAIIGPGFGREWRRFITSLSKCIIERVTSSHWHGRSRGEELARHGGLFEVKSPQKLAKELPDRGE